MKDLFTDIFEYHYHYNQLLVRQLIENEEMITDRSIPLLSHSINAHQIWNSRILGNEPLGVFQIHTLEACKSIDHLNYKDTLSILNDFDLNCMITYFDSKGNEYKNMIKDILFHIGNHFTHHKGQIISDLRQQGIEPLKTDYIFFKR